MPIFRITCGQCGLSATHIRGGDRSVTSFDAEECERRCARGAIAKVAGESAVAEVATCEHLLAALPAALSGRAV